MTTDNHTFASPKVAPTRTGLNAGFDDPVHQSQQVFRRILTALAEPGTLQQLPTRESPEGMHSAAYQICLTLLDAETPVWIPPTMQTSALVSALRFHCGCLLVAEPGQAQFALTTPELTPDLSCFAQGSHEYPDRSTTLIVQVESLKAGGDWRLRGPGIEDMRELAIVGPGPHWPEMLAENRRGFPCGVDILFTAGSVLTGLPRTTQVEV